MIRVLAFCCVIGCAASASAQTYTFDLPSDDRWFYPFNFQPGTRTTASTFGTVGTPQWFFNDRDGMLYIVWNTAGQIPTGMPPESYGVCGVEVTLHHVPGANWTVDLTPDEWYTWDFNDDGTLNADGVPRGEPGDVDGESNDDDPGRTIELYGMGFGPLTSPETWTQNAPYRGGTENGPQNPRDPFPFVYQAGTNALLHVEDNVTGLHNAMLAEPVFQFTPEPWAVGVPIGYTPGAQPTSFDVVFNVNLSLSEGAVRAYYQQQLAQGRVFVAITSVTDVEVMGGSFPEFYTREAALFDPIYRAPRLVITLGGGSPGDANCDGVVDVLDHGVLADCLLGPQFPYADPACSTFDFDADADVDMLDATAFSRLVTP